MKKIFSNTEGGKFPPLFLSQIIRNENKDKLVCEVGASAGSDNIIMIDFKKYPHLLLAGATGSGKSTLLKTLICSLILHNYSSINFILIDLKRVELSIFKNLPNVLNFASSFSSAVNVLNYALNEIKRRFEVLERLGLNSNEDKKGVFNHLFIIIDEFAELILTDKKIEKVVSRISQLGRAAGVHLIICTQLPTAQVVKNLINVNMATKISLKVETHQNSRAVIGQRGAELLEPCGDALIKQGMNLKRFCVAITPKKDVFNIVKFFESSEENKKTLWQKLKAWFN